MTGSSPFAEFGDSLNSVRERNSHGALRSQQSIPNRLPCCRRPVFFRPSALTNAFGVGSGEKGYASLFPHLPRGLPFASSQARVHARRVTHTHFDCRG